MDQQPDGTVAATPPAIVRDERWLAWQARAVVNDRRTATKMRALMAAIVSGLIAWSIVQLT